MNRETRRFCIVSAAAFAVFLLLWYSIRSAGIRAEFNYLATSATACAVEEFVVENERWPTSWDELTSVSLDLESKYSWPDDFPEIEKQVEVDFGLTLEEVAKQEPSDFSAIKPRRPAYSEYKRHFASLLKSARLVLDKRARRTAAGLGVDS